MQTMHPNDGRSDGGTTEDDSEQASQNSVQYTPSEVTDRATATLSNDESEETDEQTDGDDSEDDGSEQSEEDEENDADSNDGDEESSSSSSADEDVDDDDGEEQENDEKDDNEHPIKRKSRSLPEDSKADSSDEEADRCPICLSRYLGQDVGNPESCDHTFCLECILEWSKNMNTCPVDRRSYTFILVRDTLNGKIIRQISVRKPEGVANDDDEDITCCEICGSSDHEDRLLLCDGCDMGYHLECLNPPLATVPIEEWFCPDCENENRQNLAEEVGIEDGEVMALIDDGDRQFIPTRLRPRAGEIRLLPRTRQTERVRRRIQRFRAIVPQQVQPSTSTANAGGNRITKRTATKKRKTTKRRRVTKKGRKTTKSTKRKTKSSTKRRKTTTGCGKRKRKGRRRKRRVVKKSIKSKITPQLTSKSRLADHLGVKKMLPDHFLPVMQPSAASRAAANARRFDIAVPTLHIIGPRDELVTFYDDSDGYQESGSETLATRVMARGHNSLRNRKMLSTSAVLSHRPLLSRRNASAVNSSAVPASTSSFDILGSIFDEQNVLTMKCKDITIKPDGSLQPMRRLPTGVGSGEISQRPNGSPIRGGSRNSGGNSNNDNKGGNDNGGSRADNYSQQQCNSAAGSSSTGGGDIHSLGDYYKNVGDGSGGRENFSSSDYEKGKVSHSHSNKRHERKDAKKQVDDEDIDIYSDIECGFETEGGDNERTVGGPIGELNELEMADGGSPISVDMADPLAQQDDCIDDGLNRSDDEGSDDDLVIDESVKHDEEEEDEEASAPPPVARDEEDEDDEEDAAAVTEVSEAEPEGEDSGDDSGCSNSLVIDEVAESTKGEEEEEEEDENENEVRSNTPLEEEEEDLNVEDVSSDAGEVDQFAGASPEYENEYNSKESEKVIEENDEKIDGDATTTYHDDKPEMEANESENEDDEAEEVTDEGQENFAPEVVTDERCSSHASDGQSFDEPPNGRVAAVRPHSAADGTTDAEVDVNNENKNMSVEEDEESVEECEDGNDQDYRDENNDEADEEQYSEEEGEKEDEQLTDDDAEQQQNEEEGPNASVASAENQDEDEAYNDALDEDEVQSENTASCEDAEPLANPLSESCDKVETLSRELVAANDENPQEKLFHKRELNASIEEGEIYEHVERSRHSRHKVTSGVGNSDRHKRLSTAPQPRPKRRRGSRGEYEEGEIVESPPPSRGGRSKGSRKQRATSPDEFEHASRVNINELPRIPKVKRSDSHCSNKDRNATETNGGTAPASGVEAAGFLGSGGGSSSSVMHHHHHQDGTVTTRRTGVLARLDSSGGTSEISWKKLSQNTKTRNYRDNKPKMRSEQKYYRVREQIKEREREKERERDKEREKERELMKEVAERRTVTSSDHLMTSTGSDNVRRRVSESEKDKRHQKDREMDYHNKHLDSSGKEWQQQRSGKDKTHESSKRSNSTKRDKERKHREKHKSERHSKDRKEKHSGSSAGKHTSGSGIGTTSAGGGRNRRDSSLDKMKDRSHKHNKIVTAAEKAAEKRERKEQKREKIRKELERIHREEKHREHKKREKEKEKAAAAISNLVLCCREESPPVESKEVYASGDSIIVNVNFSRPSAGKENVGGAIALLKEQGVGVKGLKDDNGAKSRSIKDKDHNIPLRKTAELEHLQRDRKKQQRIEDGSALSLPYGAKGKLRDKSSSRKRDLLLEDHSSKKEMTLAKRMKYDDSRRPSSRREIVIKSNTINNPSRWVSTFGAEDDGDDLILSSPIDSDQQKSNRSDSPIIIDDDELDAVLSPRLSDDEDDDIVEIEQNTTGIAAATGLAVPLPAENRNDEQAHYKEDEPLQSPSGPSDTADDFCNYDSTPNEPVPCSPPSPVEDDSVYDPFEPTKSPSPCSSAEPPSPSSHSGNSKSEKPEPPPLPELPPLPPEPEPEVPTPPEPAKEQQRSPLSLLVPISTLITSSTSPAMPQKQPPLLVPTSSVISVGSGLPSPQNTSVTVSSSVSTSSQSITTVSLSSPVTTTTAAAVTTPTSLNRTLPVAPCMPPPPTISLPNIRVPPPNFIPRTMPPPPVVQNTGGNTIQLPSLQTLGWPIRSPNLLFPPSQTLLRTSGNFLGPPPSIPSNTTSGTRATAPPVSLTQIGTLHAQLAMLVGVRPPTGSLAGVPPPVTTLIPPHHPGGASIPPQFLQQTSGGATSSGGAVTTQNGEIRRPPLQQDTTEVVDMDVDSPYSPGDDPSDPLGPTEQRNKDSFTGTANTTGGSGRDRFDSLLGGSVQSRKENVPAKHMDKSQGSAKGRGHQTTPSKSHGASGIKDGGSRRRVDAQRKHIVRFEVTDRPGKGAAGGAKGSSKDGKKPEDTKKEVIVKMDETQLKILDELPSSAVEMQVKEKFLKKLNRQERVREEVKLAIKPYYNKREINKDEYKEILRKSVPKICHNKSGEINPVKIKALVEGYVKKFRYHRRREGKVGGSKKS